METLSVLLTLCEENPPDTGGLPTQMPEMQKFGIFFGVRLNKLLNKQLSCHGDLRCHDTHMTPL